MAIAASTLDSASYCDAGSGSTDNTETQGHNDPFGLLRALVLRSNDAEQYGELYDAVRIQFGASGARRAFQQLFRSTFEESEALLTSMLETYPAVVISNAARAEFRAKGNQDRMVLLAKLFSLLGADAMPALETIVREFGGDAEYFVEVIAKLAESDRDALRLLRRLSSHPSVDIRSRVLAVIPDLPTEFGYGLLRGFLEDPEDSVAQEADEMERRLDARSSLGGT